LQPAERFLPRQVAAAKRTGNDRPVVHPARLVGDPQLLVLSWSFDSPAANAVPDERSPEWPPALWPAAGIHCPYVG